MTLTVALDHFRKAVALDPAYALAWAGIADAYVVLGFYGHAQPDQVRPLALEAAQRAIALDPRSAEARTALAGALLFYQGDAIGAEREFLQALAINPNYVQCRAWYALFYLHWTRGRFAEGLAEARRLVDIDPFSAYNLTVLALVLSAVGLHDEAIATATRAIETDPAAGMARYALGSTLLRAGRADDALAPHQEACRLAADSTFSLTFAARAYMAAGRIDKAREIYSRVAERARSEYVAPSMFALVALAAGEEDHALALATTAWESGDPFFIAVGAYHPDFEWFREQPEFQSIVRKLRA
jgi:tetratricopeptide (TPR) repeat protein